MNKRTKKINKTINILKKRVLIEVKYVYDIDIN